ncbi:MAG: 50S ribosomal protein L31 [Candidatus Vogelbacteria bacterium]|nr:50S ribosomal protein L31 [Candidatus Vogelbacteria bacterium]
MKKDTHPTYYPAAKVTCACGQAFTVGSTKENIKIEICSNCHPFFTGESSKILDVAGRVEKFKARQAKATKTLKKAK